MFSASAGILTHFPHLHLLTYTKENTQGEELRDGIIRNDALLPVMSIVNIHRRSIVIFNVAIHHGFIFWI